VTAPVSAPVFGVSPALFERYVGAMGEPAARDYLVKLLSSRGDPTFYCEYDRGNGDTTAAMSCRNHLTMAVKGFVMVRILTHGGKGSGALVDAPVPASVEA
jgi:hypothetical protein